jgi:diaminopimelate epimerase
VTIAFEKYHGLGNDYLVLEAEDCCEEGSLDPKWVERVCDRRLGIGSDGILLRTPATPDGKFALRILNPDGSEAEKSGNGLRIFARYLFDRGEVGGEPFAVHTPGGEVSCRVLEAGSVVRVEMGRVIFLALQESLEIDGEILEYSVASIGNPHCVVFRDELREDEIRRFGPLLETAPPFPNRTNVQFVKLLDRGRIAIEIWERGAGHTLASGSSSCAAAAVAHRLGRCDARVSVEMPGGVLSVEIGDDYQVVQQGQVVHVASGTIHDEALAARGASD